MENHHASFCHFFLKLRKTLVYLGIDSNAGAKKRDNFKGVHSYQKNRSYILYLQGTGFIPYTELYIDYFLDVVDDNYKAFTPMLLEEETRHHGNDDISLVTDKSTINDTRDNDLYEEESGKGKKGKQPYSSFFAGYLE